jgi:hypothetical protein
MRFDDGLDDEAEAVITTLVRRFEGWCDEQGLREVDSSDFQLILDWKINYGDGCLDLWSVADVDDFVLKWCPRKVSAPPQWALPMVETVANGFLFMEGQNLLARGSAPARKLSERALSLADECVARMGDPSNFGMAKSLFAGMGVDFEEGLAPEDMQGLIERFNALPHEQRSAIMGAPQPDLPVIGPVLMPSMDEVIASAVAAPVLAGFRRLNDYFQAPGRPLTSTGNIKLADAADLSEILGTEPLAEQVGDRTFRRQSASRMPDLDHWQWWAREVGALRTSKSKLVGVKVWRDRVENDPLGEARKAFEVLESFGLISSYRTHHSLPNDELMDTSAVSLLTMPLHTGGEMSYEVILDTAVEIRSRAGVPSGWGDDRAAVGFDLERILKLAERAGVVEQRDVVYEEGPYRKKQVGGTVSLTPFGVLMVVERARADGMIVETIDAVEDLPAQGLIDMLEDESNDMPICWQLLRRWLDAQPQQQEALAEVLAGLDDEALCDVLFDQTPEDLVDVFATVLGGIVESGDRNDPAAVVGFGWLADRGLIDPETVDLEVVQHSRLSMLGMRAAVNPEFFADAWGMDRTQPELLADVELISKMMPIKAVDLLEAIGKHFPDKVVAKTARREVLKVRSRLANQSR